MKRGRRKLKSCEEEDRISSLPDSLIQYILSFLPNTVETVKTSVLSKRWLHHWTHVPDLIFRFESLSHNPRDWEIFSKFVDNVLLLYSCSTVNKFVIQLLFPKREMAIRSLMSSSFGAWISFATVKGAKEVIFDYIDPSSSYGYDFPQLFYNNDSVVELQTRFCLFTPEANVNVNWKSLKILKVMGACGFTNRILRNILSGCPSLEALELRSCSVFDQLATASKCFKRLVLDEINFGRGSSVLSISAPYLEKLELLGYLNFRGLRLRDVPSLIYASLHFTLSCTGRDDGNFRISRNPVKRFLQRVQHAQELKLGGWFFKILSIVEAEGLSSPFSNCKCLAVNVHHFAKDIPRLATLLRNLPELEKLSIKLEAGQNEQSSTPVDIRDSARKNWLSRETTSKPLLHLKTVEIFGLCQKHILVLLDFVEFLLQDATALENMFIAVRGGETDVMAKVSEKLLSMPRSSPNSTINLEVMLNNNNEADVFEWPQ